MRAADDFEAIRARISEVQAERCLDVRRDEALRLMAERGVPEGTTAPDEILLEAGYAPEEIADFKSLHHGVRLRGLVAGPTMFQRFHKSRDAMFAGPRQRRIADC
jgi:hypothetical protein